MTSLERSRATSNSTPTSQRRKPVSEIPGDISHSTKTQVNGIVNEAVSKRTSKRIKSKATSTPDDSPTRSEKASPGKGQPEALIKQEKVEIDGYQYEAESIQTRTKRKRQVNEEQKRIEAPVDEGKESKSQRTTKIGESEAGVGVPSPKKSKRKKVAEIKQEETFDNEVSPTKIKQKTEVQEKDVEAQEDEENQKKTKRRRKTKEEKEAEAMPIAVRTDGLRMFIGAHVSCAKGVQNSVTNCVHIGGNAFAMFLKSQRKWENPPLQDEHKDQFRALCGDHKYDAASHVLPHGSYLVNLAQDDSEKATQAYNAFLDDLERCEALGIKLYNFHPGSTGSHPRPSAIARIGKALNRAHLATKTVKPVLETMAGGGNIIGSTFEDIRDIIAQVEDKNRIGVCLDTCHVFAAGYDLRAPAAFKRTLDEFDRIIGMKYLSALHLNDSKAPFSSHRDLHQNIGLGFLGLRAFHNVMNEPRFEGLPLVLETPIDHKDEETGKDVEDKGVWAREIKMLEGLIGTDAESAGFKAMEKELADRGAEEREKYQEAFERKQEKDRKAVEKGQIKLQWGKGKKKIGGDSDSEN